MRNALCLSACLFLLSACGSADDYWGDDRYDDHSHGYHNNVYNNGGTYYPYGNASYPRDRIYVIERQQPCNGYAYQGYCYRNKNDYQNSVAWDRDHGRDDNWYKQRKDWCNDHDCRRGDGNDRKQYVGTTDAYGRPLEPRVEKNGMQKVYQRQDEHGSSNYEKPRQQQERRYHADEKDSAVRSDANDGEQVRHYRSQTNDNNVRQVERQQRQISEPAYSREQHSQEKRSHGQQSHEQQPQEWRSQDSNSAQQKSHRRGVSNTEGQIVAPE